MSSDGAGAGASDDGATVTLDDVVASRVDASASASDAGDASASGMKGGGEGSSGASGASGASGTKTARRTYERVKLPTPEEVYQQDAMDNCALKTVMSFALGGALGGVMGVVFGAFEPMEIRAPDAPKVAITESIKQGVRAAGARSWSYAKGFAQFGALYAGSECVVEKVRASHDVANSAYAGCFTGGVMARTGGPSGIAMGCATMAALSVAMDKLMDH